MRVITGTAKGRKLRLPAGMEIRPTSDMVKEAIFNIVQFDVEGRRVLDLFAGTGQMGIEALSRGAAEATFVDRSRDAVRLIRENLELCGFKGTVCQADSLSFLERCPKFDLIFIDPPYNLGLAAKSLQKIFKFDILTECGIIICETKREETLPEASHPYAAGREYRHGAVKLTAYSREGK